jgi:endonuclease/exonuclease/phosphatase family metal-dependent hydrolase
LEILGVEMPRTRLALVASDHLPLVADIRIGQPEDGRKKKED